jgi:hypothetical protein
MTLCRWSSGSRRPFEKSEPLTQRQSLVTQKAGIPGKKPQISYILQISLFIQMLQLIVKAVPLQAWSGPEGSRKLR